MRDVHLAPETDEDDLYSGYNDYNPTFDTEVKICGISLFVNNIKMLSLELRFHFHLNYEPQWKCTTPVKISF